jgi:DNA-binding transcriptional MerR regulator
MPISDFSQATGLGHDTIRFYVRRRLITPETGSKGGCNPQLQNTTYIKTV